MSATDLKQRVEAALREEDAILKADPARSSSDPSLPLSRLHAELSLDEHHKRYKDGDPRALMAALRECARCSIPMPDWVAHAYIARYDAVLNCRAGSWDDAFGRPFPKGAHLSARRKRRTKAPAVWLAVREAQDAGRAIDEGLFAEIGKTLGLGKTLTAEFYYQQMALHNAGLPEIVQILLEPMRVPEKSKK